MVGCIVVTPATEAQSKTDKIVLNLPTRSQEFGKLKRIAPQVSYWEEKLNGEAFANLSGRVTVDRDIQLAIIVDDTLTDPFPTLQKLPIENVYCLSLSGSTFITDETIRKLLRFTNLRRLQIDKTEISDAALVSLSALTNLEYLDVSRTRVTGATLSSLSPLKKLRHLRLVSNALDGSKLSPVARIPQLEWLSIRHCRLRDPHLEFLQHCQRIKYLEICDNNLLSNKCMRYLAKLPKLGFLMINGTCINFAGLCELKSCPLGFIKISTNVLSASELSKLRKIFPHSAIKFDNTQAKQYRLFKELLD